MHLLALLFLYAAPAAAAAPQTGGGWLANPTPANWRLIDRDGEWTLGAQGGWQAPGMDDMPDMAAAGWVETNGHHGYGCACMNVTTDRRTRRVTRFYSATPLAVRQCRADRRLPRL